MPLTEAQKKAIKKYRETHREKVNEIERNRARKLRESSPEFAQREKDKSKAQRCRQKVNAEFNRLAEIQILA